MWNAAFPLVGLDAIYLPFDVSPSGLKELAAALKESEHLLGVNVTVPHKIEIMQFLDEVDSAAARIGAVNTIRRDSDGRLIGYNTDGEGFVESVLTPDLGVRGSLIESFKGLTVLLLGAGGSSRAVAFHVGERLENGRLLLCNRTLTYAEALAADLNRCGIPCTAVPESDLVRCAPESDLIVNTTTKGQGGIRTTSGGPVSMEPYSALAPAPAAPAKLSGSGATACTDVEENQAMSLAIAYSIPRNTAFYDLIYFPEETVFLRHGRMTGHRTQNGKAMIICQAAIAFWKWLCAEQIRKIGLNERETYLRVRKAMSDAW